MDAGQTPLQTYEELTRLYTRQYLSLSDKVQLMDAVLRLVATHQRLTQPTTFDAIDAYRNLKKEIEEG
jgi:hypothetical protein